MSKTQVVMMVDGRVKVTLSDKGFCKRCGDQIVYAKGTGIWLHVDRIRGTKYYDHEARRHGLGQPK